jgi:hypothetical protein
VTASIGIRRDLAESTIGSMFIEYSILEAAAACRFPKIVRLADAAPMWRPTTT